MHAAWGHIIGVITVVLMTTFIGIWVWAWRKRHRAVFRSMASLPMEDGDVPSSRHQTGERT